MESNVNIDDGPVFLLKQSHEKYLKTIAMNCPCGCQVSCLIKYGGGNCEEHQVHGIVTGTSAFPANCDCKRLTSIHLVTSDISKDFGVNLCQVCVFPECASGKF